MSAAPPKAAPKPADPLAKAWKRTAPVRKTLAWAFVLHGTLRLGTDFWSLREPFILTDVRQWSEWVQQRIADARGVKVKVGS